MLALSLNLCPGWSESACACRAERHTGSVIGGGLVNRLGGDHQAQVDRRDNGLDELRRVGFGRKLAAFDGPGYDRLCAPEAVLEEAPPGVRDLRYPGRV
jgi:hypothetical protein